MQDGIVIISGRVCNRVYLLIIWEKMRDGEWVGYLRENREDKDTGKIERKSPLSDFKLSAKLASTVLPIQYLIGQKFCSAIHLQRD